MAVDKYKNPTQLNTLTELANNDLVLAWDANEAITEKLKAITHTNYQKQISKNISEKKAIINGDFNIWQRGTSFVSPVAYDYTADRWQYYKNGLMTHTITQDTDVPTFAQSGLKSNYSLKIDCTTIDGDIGAGDAALVQQSIEGYNYKYLDGKTCTLSFWVKATKIGIYCVAFTNQGGDRTYVAEYTVNVTDIWEKKEITLTFDYTGGTWDYKNLTGLGLRFTIAAGSTWQTTKDSWQNGNYFATSNQVNACDNVANDFRIDQVQLEVGDVATDYEQWNITEELLRCQRYYWKASINSSLWGYEQAANTIVTFISSPVTMRSAPTISGPATYTLFIAGSSYIVTPGAGSLDPHGIAISFTGTFSHIYYAGMVRPNTNAMEFSAEL